MSGRFFTNGHELTAEEYREARRRTRIKRTEKRLERCDGSLGWFGKALDLPISFDLAGMIREIEVNGSAGLYDEPKVIQKSHGGERIIITPKPELKRVQRGIHRLLLDVFKRPPISFGFRGGSCYEVAERHQELPSTLKFDIKDAFFQVGWAAVRKSMLRNSPFQRGTQGLSHLVTRWIASLCTYHNPVPLVVRERFPRVTSFLPQGSPASPICFDMACWPLDAKLTHLAERVGGRVTRYADNYFFSMPTSRVSEKLRNIVVYDARRYGFPIHKIRRVAQGEMCRILGYNVYQDRVTNTRDFNRNLRGAIYVLRTRLERDLEWHDAYARVRGFLGFAVNTPEGLLQEYRHCEQLMQERSSKGAQST